MNNEEFEIIKNTIKNISSAKKLYQTGIFEKQLPRILGLKLTNRCNLRCKHCYEWNDQGYHHNLEEHDQSGDLDVSLILQCIDQTKDVKPAFYLWGGEPLIHYKIGEVLQLLADKNAITAICTNGHAILKQIENLKQLGSNLELLIALEGDEETNDVLRGRGSYRKTMAAIEKLTELKEQGEFKGKISVHTMISNENIGTLKAYINTMQEKGIENLILCFPWYLSDQTSMDMDKYYNEKYSWLNDEIQKVKSWHAFKYKIEEKNYEKVLETIKSIKMEKWKINVKIQPDIKMEEIKQFLTGEVTIQNKESKCLSVYSRMDILPNGKVTSCKHFPEFTLGDLSKQTVEEIWNSNAMNQMRWILKTKMPPVCSKCNNLYLHGYQKITN